MVDTIRSHAVTVVRVVVVVRSAVVDVVLVVRVTAIGRAQPPVCGVAARQAQINFSLQPTLRRIVSAEMARHS